MLAKVLFGGKEKSSSNTVDIRNSYSKKVVSKYQVSSIQDVQSAMDAAMDAFVNTKNTPLYRRIKWLEDVALKLQNQEDSFAKVITDEVSKPISFSKIEVQRSVAIIKSSIFAMSQISGETFHSDLVKMDLKPISYYKRVPAGVVVCITPFNFPLNLIIHKLAPALIAGNSVVLKPTPEAPLVAYMIAKLFIDSEYAIDGAISIVYGDSEIGEALVSNSIPRVISFTGSSSVGKEITSKAGIKKISLELGGNAATFIDKSADIAQAAKRCAYGAFYLSGQVCISLQRVYIHEDIFDIFLGFFIENTRGFRIGDPYDEDTFMGPLISSGAVLKTKKAIKDACSMGAKIAYGGQSEDNFFYPTILVDVQDDMDISCKEIFAPLVNLIKVSSYDEAIARINNSIYGLQYSVFTNSLSMAKRAIDDLDAGGVLVNEIPTLRIDNQPYGGFKYSGLGKEGARFAIEELTEIKSVVIC